MVADGGEEIKMMMRSRESLGEVVILLDSQSVNLSGAHYHQNIKHLILAL